MQYHGIGFKTTIRETCFPGNEWGWRRGAVTQQVWGTRDLMCWENGRYI